MSTQNDPPSALPRVIGLWTATAIVAGTIIGSGIFFKPNRIAELVPYSGLVAVVWLLGGALTLVGALIYLEVCVLLPRAGGNYVFLREGYGRLFGWMWGWVDFWMIRAGSIAALATAFTTSLHDIYRQAYPKEEPVSEWGQRGVTITLLLLLGAVNIRGVKLGAGLQLVITIIKVGTILGVALLPFAVLAMPAMSPDGFVPSTAKMTPVWPEVWSFAIFSGLTAAMLQVLWPYHGWMNIAPIAGEVKEPQRTLPLALLSGVLVVVALYLSCNVAYYLTLSGEELAKAGTPATAVAQRLIGPAGVMFLSAVIMCSVLGALNGNVLVGPRLLFAMGEDGLAPRWLREVHPAWKTPAAAIMVLVGWSVLLVIGVGLRASGKGPFDQLTDFAMFGAVIFETMAVLAVFRLRAKMPNAERAYRCPGYPWLPALYVVVPAAILVNMLCDSGKPNLNVYEPTGFWGVLDALLGTGARRDAFIGLAFIGLGVVVYYALGLWRTPEPRPAAPEGAILPAQSNP
jgi:basic amino acid/polyamine antiporter, APA family